MKENDSIVEGEGDLSDLLKKYSMAPSIVHHGGSIFCSGWRLGHDCQASNGIQARELVH